MRRKAVWGFLVLCALAAAVRPAAAQSSPIVIGPTSTLAWDDLGLVPAVAGTLTAMVAIDGAAPKALTGVVCGAGPTAADSTCAAPISQIPTGSHTVTVANVSGTVSSLPSTPFAYVDVLIAVPANVRAKPDDD